MARAARPGVWRIAARPRAARGRRRAPAATGGAAAEAAAARYDLYAILGIDASASSREIKLAFRARAFELHPDMNGASGAADAHGDAEGGTGHAHSSAFSDAMAAANAAYAVLSDVEARAVYDAAHASFGSDSLFGGYDGRPLSATLRPNAERALFIDENACIGCMACVHEAPHTIAIEDERGRARVGTQHADSEDALESARLVCPTSAVHWVASDALALLEWVHRSQPRSNFVFLREGSGTGGLRGCEEDPFVAARLLERRAMEAVQETMAGYGGMVGAKGIGRANAEGPANGGGRHDGELGGTVRRRRRAGAWWRGGGRRLSHSELEWALVGQACPWRSPGAVMLLPPPQHRAPPRADAAAV